MTIVDLKYFPATLATIKVHTLNRMGIYDFHEFLEVEENQ